MGYALGHGQGWGWGYRYISIIQIVLTALLIASLPLWKQRKATDDPSIADNPANPFPLHENHWASVGFCAFAVPRRSDDVLLLLRRRIHRQALGQQLHGAGNGIDKITAASWAGFLRIGITAGRVLSGFLTMRFGDPIMIRIGQSVMFPG